MRHFVAFGDPRMPQRFWDKVMPEPMGGCWLWIASATNVDYGQYSIGGRAVGMKLAHRVSYAGLVGPIAAKLTIDHLCRNTRCVNPAHLEMVTQRHRAKGNERKRQLRRERKEANA